jgi:single-strand DNA-binding protein
MNIAHLIGRVGQTPEIRSSQNGKTVATLSLATTERWRDKSGERQEKTIWHNLVCWQEGLCKVIEQYVNKGDMLAITGKIENRKYEKDGQTKYISEIIISDLEMLTSKQDKQGETGSWADNPPAQQKPVMDSAPSFARDDLQDEVPF